MDDNPDERVRYLPSESSSSEIQELDDENDQANEVGDEEGEDLDPESDFPMLDRQMLQNSLNEE